MRNRIPLPLVGIGIGLASTLFAAPCLSQDAAGENIDNANALIDFNPPPEIELNLLIQMVSDELDLKILYDEKIGGQRVRMLVPTQIPRTSLRGLLESSLRMKGFALVQGEEDGWLQIVEARNLLNIAPPPPEVGAEGDAADQPASAALTKVFRLEHADPQRVEQAIRPFLTEPGGNILTVAEQRLLIVTDYTPRISRIEGVLALIDRPQREVEVRFHTIENLDAREAADELTRILQARRRAASGGAGGVGDALALEIVQQPRTNRLVLIGDPAQLEAATELLASIDVSLGLETRLYRFSSVSPQKVDDLVQNLIDPMAKERQYRSSVDEENGLLVVTTTPGIHEQVAAVQSDLDREIEAGQPVVRYYKLANAKATEVIATIQQIEGISVLAATESFNQSNQEYSAPENRQDPSRQEPELFDPSRPNLRGDEPSNWRSQTSGGGSSPIAFAPSVQTEDATLVSDPNTNSIIVLADESRQQFYWDIIKQLDKRRPQVMIEVTLVAISTSDGKSVGVEISRQGDDGDDPRVISFSSFGLADSASPADIALAAGLGFNGILLSEDIANVVLRALKTDGDTEVLSAPKILVNDNATGRLTSVTDAPFASINASNTVSSTSFGGFESAGTTIDMTPQISEGEHLTLTYAIELSTFGEGGSDTTPPPRQRQQINSEVTIPDGQTIVVGGLKRNDFSRTVSRVPWIGEIPIIEYLFSSRSTNESEATLFVFIRPVVLRDDDFADLKYLSQRDLDTAGLPGDYPTSTPLLIP